MATHSGTGTRTKESGVWKTRPAPVYHKVFIRELREERGCFYLYGKPVTHVDIVGTLLYSIDKSKHTLMSIDDNTAVINAIFFHDGKKSEETVHTKKEGFEGFMRQLSVRKNPKAGDVVGIIGRLNKFVGKWQIVIKNIVVIRDLNAEWFRVREIEALRKRQAIVNTNKRTKEEKKEEVLGMMTEKKRKETEGN